MLLAPGQDLSITASWSNQACFQSLAKLVGILSDATIFVGDSCFPAILKSPVHMAHLLHTDAICSQAICTNAHMRGSVQDGWGRGHYSFSKSFAGLDCGCIVTLSAFG